MDPRSGSSRRFDTGCGRSGRHDAKEELMAAGGVTYRRPLWSDGTFKLLGSVYGGGGVAKSAVITLQAQPRVVLISVRHPYL